MRKPLSIRGNMNRVMTAGMLLLWAVWSAPTPAFGHAADNWTCANGATDKNWSDKLNWDNGVPTAGSNVVITNVCPSIVDQSFSISSLGIVAGGAATDGAGISLTINGTSIANNGQLFVDNSSNRSAKAQLAIGRSVVLSGNGLLVMSNSTNNLISGAGSLSNGSQQTIEGAGLISVDALNNQGTIIGNFQNTP